MRLLLLSHAAQCVCCVAPLARSALGEGLEHGAEEERIRMGVRKWLVLDKLAPATLVPIRVAETEVLNYGTLLSHGVTKCGWQASMHSQASRALCMPPWARFT